LASLDTDSHHTGDTFSRRDHLVGAGRVGETVQEDATLDAIKQSILASANIQSIVSASQPAGKARTDLISRIKTGLTPSPASTSGGVLDAHESSIYIDHPGAEIPARVFASLPSALTYKLVGKFMRCFLSGNLILREPDVWQQLERVLQIISDRKAEVADPRTITVAPSYDMLVIYLVLAITVTLDSFKGGHEARCMELSASLFNEGIRHLSERAGIPDDLAGLQVTLLTLHSAIINPHFGNVWVLCGVAMRACLELGLHREPPLTAQFDPAILEYRRCLFWAAYCVDRTICSALQMPLSIADASINTQLPQAAQEAHTTKNPLLLLIQYHQLRSLIIQVHFQNAPLPANLDWEDWLSDMEIKLRAWYGSYRATKPEISELTEFEFAHTMLFLHRPSPRNPQPSDRSLLEAFKAAAASARILKEDIYQGFLRRRWLSAYHTLEMAMIALFCLRYGSRHLRKRFSVHQIFEIAKLFTSNFLAIAALGWTEVSAFARTYERLLAPLLDFIFSGEDDPESFFGPAEEAQLRRWLYPGQTRSDAFRFEAPLHMSTLDDFTLFDVDRMLEDLDPGNDNSSAGIDVNASWADRNADSEPWGCWDLLNKSPLESRP
jgi:hypothetical protein